MPCTIQVHVHEQSLASVLLEMASTVCPTTNKPRINHHYIINLTPDFMVFPLYVIHLSLGLQSSFG